MEGWLQSAGQLALFLQRVEEETESLYVLSKYDLTTGCGTLFVRASSSLRSVSACPLGRKWGAEALSPAVIYRSDRQHRRHHQPG